MIGYRTSLGSVSIEGEVLAACDCTHDEDGAIDRNGTARADPGVGQLHYTFCGAFGMELEDEIAWRKARLARTSLDNRDALTDQA